LKYRANDEGRRNESQKGQVPAAWLAVSFRDGMNRTPITSPLLLVGRDTIETWHGSNYEYREGDQWGGIFLTEMSTVVGQSTHPALFWGS
jgi:hypothetical protein